MELEQTIQMCFDKHAMMFENRKQVLIHLFCKYGTEFEWKDGELVNIQENWTRFKGTLGNDGKAKQRKNIENLAIKLAYDIETKERNAKCLIPVITFKEFQRRMKEVKTECIRIKKEGHYGNDFTFKKLILKEYVGKIQYLRNSHLIYVTEQMCREHSPIFNVPKDIKKDWADGLTEIKTFLEDINVDLNDIK